MKLNGSTGCPESVTGCCASVTKRNKVTLLVLLLCELYIAFLNSNMDSNGTKSPYEDKWDAEGGRQSLQSAKKGSRGSLRCQEEDNNDENAEKTRTWLSDSDQDQRSDVDGRRSTPSFYSDEYDSPSEDSRSPYSQSRFPYHSPQRRIQAKTTSSTPINKKGMHCKKKIKNKKCYLLKCPGGGSVGFKTLEAILSSS